MSACLCTNSDGNKNCSEHGGRTPTRPDLLRAATLAAKTDDAYSAQSYKSWTAVALLLLARRYSEQEAEAIMRSKWTRWAGDARSSNENLPAKALGDFLDSHEPERLKRDVAQLVAETFGVPARRPAVPNAVAFAERVANLSLDAQNANFHAKQVSEGLKLLGRRLTLAERKDVERAFLESSGAADALRALLQ